jgi:truncated hemoglobin YjbI
MENEVKQLIELGAHHVAKTLTDTEREAKLLAIEEALDELEKVEQQQTRNRIIDLRTILKGK